MKFSDQNLSLTTTAVLAYSLSTPSIMLPATNSLSFKKILAQWNITAMWMTERVKVRVFICLKNNFYLTFYQSLTCIQTKSMCPQLTTCQELNLKAQSLELSSVGRFQSPVMFVIFTLKSEKTTLFIFTVLKKVN